MDTVFVTLPLTINYLSITVAFTAAHLNTESFWWWHSSGGNSASNTFKWMPDVSSVVCLTCSCVSRYINIWLGRLFLPSTLSHLGLGCVTTHWHQQEHQGVGCVTTHRQEQEHQGVGCVTTHQGYTKMLLSSCILSSATICSLHNSVHPPKREIIPPKITICFPMRRG